MNNFVPLGDLCLKITKGTTPNTRDGGFADHGVNYIKSESLSYDGSIDTTKFAFVSEETNQRLKRSIIQDGDILYSIAGANLGKCGIARSEHLPANTNQAVAIIRVDERRASSGFISFCLRNPSFVQSVLGGVAQSAQPNVNLADIGRFRIPNLALSEQRAIAATLGALDDKIELNRKMNATLEAMARALFRDWFVDFGPTHAKMEGRAPYLSPDLWSLFPDRLDDEGKPEGWDEKGLLELANLISGGTPKTDKAEFWNGDIRWASAKDVSQCKDAFLIETERRISESGLKNSATKIIPKYATVIVARGATTGRSCMFGSDIAMNQTCYALTSQTSHSFWLNCAFRELVDRLVNAAHGSVFDTITTRTIEAVSLVQGPKELRDQFEQMVTPLFQRLLANVTESRTLAQTRDLLLPRLMSGELRVADLASFDQEAVA